MTAPCRTSFEKPRSSRSKKASCCIPNFAGQFDWRRSSIPNLSTRRSIDDDVVLVRCVMEEIAYVDLRPIEIDELNHGSDENLLWVRSSRLQPRQTLSLDGLGLGAGFVYRPTSFFAKPLELLSEPI